jgi:DNA-binding transcriptional LysR family regulator
MHSRLLRHFLAVLEHRSISAAAEAVHISQPALTKSIRQLETTLGVSLFERRPNGVVPTPFGEILGRRVRLMALEYEHAITEIQTITGGSGGIVHVGAGPVWMLRLLPPVIAKFHIHRPKVKVSIRTGVIDTLVPALLGGEMDVICATLDFPSHPEIVKEHLTDIKHTLTANTQHPLAQRDEVTPSDLLGYPWIMLANDYVGASRVNSFFAANELAPPHVAVETSSIASVLSLLQAGNYIVSLPTIMLPYIQAFGLAQLATRGTLWESPAGIAYRRTKTPIPTVQAFCAMVRSSFEPPEPARE